MFLQDFTYVDLPRTTVRRLLDREGTDRLTALTAAAAAEGEDLCGGTANPAQVPALAAGTVVSVGDHQDLGDVTLVPLEWLASPGSDPLATADLELAELGSTRTQLTLLGRTAGGRQPGPYDRRMIQATMRSFLFHLAQDIEVAGLVEAYPPVAMSAPVDPGRRSLSL